MEDALLPEKALGGVDSSPYSEEIAFIFQKIAAVQSRSGDPDRPIIVGRVPCSETTDTSSDEITGCVIVGPDRRFKLVDNYSPFPSAERRRGDVILDDIQISKLLDKSSPRVIPEMTPGVLQLPNSGDEEFFLDLPASDVPPILATSTPSDVLGFG